MKHLSCFLFLMLVAILTMYFYNHSVTGAYTFSIPVLHQLIMPAGMEKLSELYGQDINAEQLWFLYDFLLPE